MKCGKLQQIKKKPEETATKEEPAHDKLVTGNHTSAVYVEYRACNVRIGCLPPGVCF